MDDESCVMKFIEIVPLTSSVEGSELPDLKETVQVKVCIFTLLLFFLNLKSLQFKISFGFGVLSQTIGARALNEQIFLLLSDCLFVFLFIHLFACLFDWLLG